MATTLEHPPASERPGEKGTGPTQIPQPLPAQAWYSPSGFWPREITIIALLSISFR
jgi:hypothetical protein